LAGLSDLIVRRVSEEVRIGLKQQMPKLPDVQEESRTVGIPLPERSLGTGIEHVQYGVYAVAATYCGLPVPPRFFAGEWQHGWHPDDTVPHPEMITGTDGLSRHRRESQQFLVAREDQAQVLRRVGYRSVESVGLPIVYQPQPAVERSRGSLLVMPVHSLEYTKHDWNFEQYAQEIDAIRHRFSSVVVCISGPCFRRGYWVAAFERRGFPLISGAELSDANSYPRLAHIFSRFEFMTTNGFGSHLLYSALFGTKPSIYGTIAPLRADDFQGDGLYQNNPDVLTHVLELNTPAALRRRFPELFTLPWAATTRADWAAFQAGVQCKRAPGDLKQLLGWTSATSRRWSAAVATKIARVSHDWTQRVTDGAEHAKQAALTVLRQATPGDVVRVSSPYPGLQSNDGARFAWELESFFYGDGLNVKVNPPDAAALDLSPREGVSVIALARHHPYRRIYYLTEDGDNGERVRQNLVASSDGQRLVPLRLRCTPAPDETSACAADPLKQWSALREQHRDVLAEVAVFRTSLTEETWPRVLGALEDLPCCRLLLLECHDQPQAYLGLLLTKLAEQHFVVDLGKLKWSSFRSPGVNVLTTILSLVCTRSGLKLPGVCTATS
jgi:hypothetical protein